MRTPQQRPGKGHPPPKNILNNKTEASGASPLQPPRLHTRPHHWTSVPGLGLGVRRHSPPASPRTPGHSVRATDPWFEGLSALEKPQTGRA